eukprot:CAMPEP_0178819974 /NCGR_PEP_ID=MMETSP0746-20121128/3262_1 /TAXON_ID=913974 /ORGANISM="Nitzschia punctata, Strain CCMP561" /LENGTH=70 /DNA_ID=CAMNT_0020481283 /DNA_START=69 /DNA_END=281 /DNA_ORIENTATION=-
MSTCLGYLSTTALGIMIAGGVVVAAGSAVLCCALVVNSGMWFSPPASQAKDCDVENLPIHSDDVGTQADR